MSNSLAKDQARQNTGPDLGPNCLQRLSADDTSRQSLKPVKEVVLTSYLHSVHFHSIKNGKKSTLVKIAKN